MRMKRTKRTATEMRSVSKRALPVTTILNVKQIQANPDFLICYLVFFICSFLIDCIFFITSRMLIIDCSCWKTEPRVCFDCCLCFVSRFLRSSSASGFDDQKMLQRYNRREFWFYRPTFFGARELLYYKRLDGIYEIGLGGFMLFFIHRYFPVMIIVCLFVLSYGQLDSYDVITPLEICVVFVLLCMKFLNILRYSYGPQFVAPHEVHEILQETFGQHIATIIKLYLPLFYDAVNCPAKLLVQQEFVHRFDYEEVELLAL